MKEKLVKGRDWNAVDAHFRRGGPMKHKNTPRGGAKKNDPEIEEALEELEDDESRTPDQGDKRGG